METETTARDPLLSSTEAPGESPDDAFKRRWEEHRVWRRRQDRYLLLSIGAIFVSAIMAMTILARRMEKARPRKALVTAQAAYSLCMRADPSACGPIGEALTLMAEEDFCEHREGSR